MILLTPKGEWLCLLLWLDTTIQVSCPLHLFGSG